MQDNPKTSNQLLKSKKIIISHLEHVKTSLKRNDKFLRNE